MSPAFRCSLRMVARGWSVLFVIFLVGVPGCGSSGGPPSPDSRVLTAEQMGSTQAANVMEAIRRARPIWLRDRSPRSLGALDTRILIYLNDVPQGPAREVLPSMPLDGIHRIEYRDAVQAGLLPGAGSGHIQAAFMIYTTPPR